MGSEPSGEGLLGPTSDSSISPTVSCVFIARQHLSLLYPDLALPIAHLLLLPLQTPRLTSRHVTRFLTDVLTPSPC